MIGRNERRGGRHEEAAAQIPVDRGQHWTLWLLEWARYNRDAFVHAPDLLTRYVGDGITAEDVADHTESILEVLVRQGFSPREASAAYELVSSCAIGFAVSAIRQANAAGEGRDTWAEYEELLDRRGEELPNLRALIDELRVEEAASLEQRLVPVLAGIAARRGQSWAEVQAALAAGGEAPVLDLTVEEQADATADVYDQDVGDDDVDELVEEPVEEPVDEAVDEHVDDEGVAEAAVDAAAPVRQPRRRRLRA